MQVGDEAPLARQDVRKFPEWYKPYTLNYDGDGYLILMFSGLMIAGWSYTNDIKEQKGRKSLKVFDDTYLQTPTEKRQSTYLARQRLAAGDADFEKFTHVNIHSTVKFSDTVCDTHEDITSNIDRIRRTIEKKGRTEQINVYRSPV